MEIFQTIWTALTTPNELLINITGLFLCFIEVFINMSKDECWRFFRRHSENHLIIGGDGIID